MVALVLQVVSISIVIAGVWLSDFTNPTKMIVLGLTGSIFFFLQYQLTSFLEHTAKSIAELNIWVRILECSLELSRREPENTDSARNLVMQEIQDENKRSAFEDRLLPKWPIDAISLAGVVVLSLALSWGWVVLYRHVF